MGIGQRAPSTPSTIAATGQGQPSCEPDREARGRDRTGSAGGPASAGAVRAVGAAVIGCIPPPSRCPPIRSTLAEIPMPPDSILTPTLPAHQHRLRPRHAVPDAAPRLPAPTASPHGARPASPNTHTLVSRSVLRDMRRGGPGCECERSPACRTQALAHRCAVRAPGSARGRRGELSDPPRVLLGRDTLCVAAGSRGQLGRGLPGQPDRQGAGGLLRAAAPGRTDHAARHRQAAARRDLRPAGPADHGDGAAGDRRAVGGRDRHLAAACRGYRERPRRRVRRPRVESRAAVRAAAPGRRGRPTGARSPPRSACRSSARPPP